MASVGNSERLATNFRGNHIMAFQEGLHTLNGNARGILGSAGSSNSHNFQAVAGSHGGGQPLWTDGYSPGQYNDSMTSSALEANANTSFSSSLNMSHETPTVSINYGLTTMIAVAVILFLLILVTAFGNFLVILSLFKFRNLRTVSNYLIGNLALSDFLLATTILPLSGVTECLGYWVFGEIICNMWLCLDVLYCTASIWNLCIIALDRFTATLYPIWYREKRSTKQAAIYISVVWVFSAAICVPPLLGWNPLSSNFQTDDAAGPTATQCMLFQTQSYVLYSASGSFFIPFIITIILYVRIFLVLHSRMKKMRAANEKRFKHTPNNNQPHKDMQSKVMLNNLKKDQQFELSAVPNQSASGNTDELSSQNMFDSESEQNDADSSTQLRSDNPLYVSSSDAEGPQQLRMMKNGIKDRNKATDTLVISNPAHRLTSDSDHDSDAKTPLNKHSCSDKEPPSAKTKLLSVPTIAIKKSPEQHRTGSGRKAFGSALKHVNPFSKTKEKSDKGRTSQKKRYDQREVRATIRMAIIIAFFCGCWIGFFLIYVIRAWCPDLPLPRTVDAFFFWLGYANSAMNPILYTIFNDDFRRSFQKLLGCYQRNRNGMVSGSATRTRH